MSVVLDGQPLAERHTNVPLIVFSPDGNRIAYIAGEGGEVFPVVNGSRGERAPSIRASSVMFSLDSRRFTYVADVAQGRKALFLDGQRVRESPAISDPVFSPDGRHIAHVELLGGNNSVLVDGKVVSGDFAVPTAETLVFERDHRVRFVGRRGAELFRASAEVPGS